MPKEHYTDLARMEALLIRAEEGSLASVDADGQPYITVVNHLYIHAGDVPDDQGAAYGRIFFHCALSGRKLDNIAHEPRIAFSVYEVERVAIGEHSCDCTVYYDSVIVFGTARFVNDHPEKQAILDALTAKHAGHKLPSAPGGEVYARTGLVEITLREMTGKRRYEDA